MSTKRTSAVVSKAQLHTAVSPVVHQATVQPRLLGVAEATRHLSAAPEYLVAAFDSKMTFNLAKTGLAGAKHPDIVSRVVEQMMPQYRLSRRRRVTAIHEAGHAAVAELLIPGFVDYAYCFTETKIMQADDDGVAPHLVGQPARGRTRYSQKQIDECGRADIGSQNLTMLYSIAISLAAGMFERKFGISTHEEIEIGRKGDLLNVIRMYDANGVPPEVRNTRTDAAAQIADRLASSKTVRNVVQKIADTMFNDVRISGERIREIIAADIGSRVELLASLGIPTALGK